MLALGLLYMAFIMLKNVSSILTLLRVYVFSSQSCAEFCKNTLSAFIEWTMRFYPSFQECGISHLLTCGYHANLKSWE